MYRVKLVAQLSQAVEEEEVVPHIVQLISPPFLGRTVLTAGPAKFGMDLTKQEHGVSTSNTIQDNLSCRLLTVKAQSRLEFRDVDTVQ